MSVNTAERSFSTLRRVETLLRSRMQEDRLTSLYLLCVHREVKINIDQIIDRFGKSDNIKRRLDQWFSNFFFRVPFEYIINKSRTIND
jgi:hypothetical protein